MLYCKMVSGLPRKSTSIFNKSEHYPQSESALITQSYSRVTQSPTASKCKDVYLTCFLLDPFRNRATSLQFWSQIFAGFHSLHRTFNACNKPASRQSICCASLCMEYA